MTAGRGERSLPVNGHASRFDRREFLTASLAAGAGFVASSESRFAAGLYAAAPAPADQTGRQDNPLARQVGITTSSLAGHVAAKPGPGQFTLEALPAVLRDELGIRVIDLNTSTIQGLDRSGLDTARNAAEKSGSVFTNLKLNQRGLALDSSDENVRRRAMQTYQQSIDAAAILGCRWVRVLPTAERPHLARYVEALRELASYGQQHQIRLLIENYGWMEDDPQSVPKLIAALGGTAAACPDTGNWANNEIRHAGLKAAFPRAVSCDFKAITLGPRGEHEAYDLRRCFELGWQAGFRGPWCLEHANRDRKALFRELALLRDMLQGWMKAADAAS